MKKIAFYINNLGAGGAERVCVNLANYLCDYADITIVTGNCVSEYAISNKVNTVSLDFNYALTKGKKIVEVFRRRRKLASYFKENDFDVIVGFGFSVNILIGLIFIPCFGNKKRPKLIFCEHNNHTAIKSKLLVFIRNYIYKNYGELLVLTKRDKDYYCQNSINSRVINNPIPKYHHYSKLNKNKFLFVGRLEYQKNIPGLVSIIRKCCQVNPEFEFTIVGDGSLKGYLLSSLSELINCGRVKYLPKTNDVSKYYIESRALLLMSHYEGLPMVLIESLAHGLPQISYDCPTGPAEIVNNDTGYLVELYDEDDFISKIMLLNNNDSIAYSMSLASKIASEKYDIERVGESWIELLYKDKGLVDV